MQWLVQHAHVYTSRLHLCLPYGETLLLLSRRVNDSRKQDNLSVSTRDSVYWHCLHHGDIFLGLSKYQTEQQCKFYIPLYSREQKTCIGRVKIEPLEFLVVTNGGTETGGYSFTLLLEVVSSEGVAGL